MAGSPPTCYSSGWAGLASAGAARPSSTQTKHGSVTLPRCVPRTDMISRRSLPSSDHERAPTADPLAPVGARTAGDSHLDASHVTAETSRRIACDASIVPVIENEEGQLLSIGRKSRVIPPGIRRALRARDYVSRFPGCTNTFYIDAHHIDHWANGGETSLASFVQLGRQNHRLVHEGGFHCEKGANDNLLFRNPRQLILGRYVLPTPIFSAGFLPYKATVRSCARAIHPLSNPGSSSAPFPWRTSGRCSAVSASGCGTRKRSPCGHC